MVRTILGLVLACLSAGAQAQAVAPVEVAQALARELSDGKYDAALARFDPALQKQFPRAELARAMDPRRAHGPVVKTSVARRQPASDGTTVAVRLKWKNGLPTEVQATVRPDGRVAHLLIWDDDDPIYNYVTKASLRPPFAGEWTASYATRDPENKRSSDPRRRFSFDWVIRDAKGNTHKDAGKRNADYFAYGKNAFAPAAGTVVVAVDGVPENATPGEVDNYDLLGNHVVVELGPGEYAVLASLQPGLGVKRGQKVARGQRLGKIGNSGQALEPTLSFAIADAARLTDAKSLPVTFRRVLVDGEQAEEWQPIFGTRLAPAEHWDPRGRMHEEDED
jgi:murein DD-endopeptidase MepM/ murein hydrolase activator NlpD